MSEVWLFAGPTLLRAQAMEPTLSLQGIAVLPPIGRGDLPRLLRSLPAGSSATTTLVLVDGLFHLRLAVGHAEIRAALDAGFRVFGLSSMGAIRAREMAALGMEGFGEVYRLYCQPEVDFRDDEVTLLHDPEPPYRELSEPLVHLRAALDDLVQQRLLPAEVATGVLDKLSRTWFGDRTLPALRALLASHGLVESQLAAIDEQLADFDRYRVKALDLIAFLQTRPDRLPRGETAALQRRAAAKSE